MEVVLTGRLVLLHEVATATAEAAPNKTEEEKKLASHEDTALSGPVHEAKMTTTASERRRDAASGLHEETTAPGVAAGAETSMVVDEAAHNKDGAKYRWEGKWYFRGNKNKSSTFAYEVLWSHQNDKIQQQPQQSYAGQQLRQEDLNKECLLESSDKKSDINHSDKSTPAIASAAVEMTKVLAASKPSPKTAGACASNFPPLSLMAEVMENDATIDEQLNFSLLSDLPSNLLLGDDNIFDLNRAGVDFLDTGRGLIGVGGEEGMHVPSVVPTTAEPMVAEKAAAAAAAGSRLSDLFPFDACAKCHGGFLVHNPTGEGVNEIAETFELTIMRPGTGVVTNGNSSSSYVEVLGEGQNVYGDFILEGKINAQHGLRMICHRRYKSDLAKRTAKANKAKNTTNNNNANNDDNKNDNNSASLADVTTALDASNSNSTAPCAGEHRRASNRITLGVRKTPLFLDQDAGGAGFNLAMPVSATFASSSAGKLLKAAQACNRAELRRVWWQWWQHVVADRQEEEERGEVASAEKRETSSSGGGVGGGGGNKNGCKRKFSSSSDLTSGVGMENIADTGYHRQQQQQQQEYGGNPWPEQRQQQQQGPVAEGWVSALADEDGEVYEGEVVDGERDGVGICLFPNGLLYQGTWAQGKEHGSGKLMTHGRCLIYDGEWSEGKMSGKGRYVFPSGGVYEGDWRENVRQGHGCYKLPGGASYEGDWREDLRWGFGVFTWADGSVYEGEWVRGVRQGKGTLRCAAFEYVGQWTENKMEGKGVCAYENGQRYEGMWRGGLKDGRGRLVLSNGAAQYEGRFREDVLDGQGTLELLEPLPGAVDDEWVIPLDVKFDVARAHVKAGFGQGGT